MLHVSLLFEFAFVKEHWPNDRISISESYIRFWLVKTQQKLIKFGKIPRLSPAPGYAKSSDPLRLVRGLTNRIKLRKRRGPQNHIVYLGSWKVIRLPKSHYSTFHDEWAHFMQKVSTTLKPAGAHRLYAGTWNLYIIWWLLDKAWKDGFGGVARFSPFGRKSL